MWICVRSRDKQKQHACSLASILDSWIINEFEKSGKWGSAPGKQNLRLLAQWARWNSNIFRALWYVKETVEFLFFLCQWAQNLICLLSVDQSDWTPYMYIIRSIVRSPWHNFIHLLYWPVFLIEVVWACFEQVDCAWTLLCFVCAALGPIFS